MNFSAWSIRNPIPSILLFVLLTFAGVLAFRAMKVQTFPDIDLPTVVVVAALPGATPAQLENDIARRLENSMATMSNLRHLRTKIQDGVVTIAAEFRLGKPTREAVDDVRDAVTRVRAELPADMRDPVIRRLNLAGAPMLTYSIGSSSLDDERLSWFVDNELSRALLKLPGVGAVQRVGGVNREVRVELDPNRLLALRISAADVSRLLRQSTQDSGGGRAGIGGGEQPLRTIGTQPSAAALAQTELGLPDGRRIRLDQFATVQDTVAERRSIAMLDGRPVVGVEIVRSLGWGEVEVAANVRRELASLTQQYPDIALDEAFNLVDAVEDNYRGSLMLLIEGAVLSIVVVFAFLRNWRATLISATALPLSVLPTFAVMHFGMGMTLNVLTMLSLSLVIGILVDDAIVEIENIIRHLGDGKSPYDAAMEAADEIGLAVIATTFTLIAVFLPTAFLSGVPGRFFVHFGWTAAISVFFSLVVARLLTPMMAAYLLKRPRKAIVEPGWVRLYARAARWCLSHRWITMVLTAVGFAGALALVPLLPSGFIPPDDLSQSQVHVTLQPGSTFDDTLAAAEQARAIVQASKWVTRVYTTIGGGATGSDPFAAGGGGDVRNAVLTLQLKHREARAGVTKQAIEAELRESLSALPGARVRVGFGASSEKFLLLLSGQDGPTLALRAREVEQQLRTIAGIGNVTSSASLVRQELVVRPDSARAADLGVSTASIAETLRVATVGDFDPLVAKLNFSQRQVKVLVRLPASARGDLDLISRLPVRGTRGPVPLSNVATLALESGPGEIDRYDRLRNVTLEIELNGQPLGEVQRAAMSLPAVQSLPPGITAAPAGDAEAMAELFDSFALAMLTGVLCIYIVLVLLFREFLQPVTILGALVLSVPGALLALFVTGTAISMPSLIGLVMLMGIATKNSILLVDYAIIARREHGLSRLDAVIDACRKRARPVVMTTVAMGAGMLPIALGIGVDATFRAPMAIVVIGGLLTSTVLSLLVIPVLYTFVDDIATRLGLRRRQAAASVPAVRLDPR